LIHKIKLKSKIKINGLTLSLKSS